MENVESKMERLVDHYGLSYAEAKKLVHREDVAQIMSYMAVAYEKGKSKANAYFGGDWNGGA